MISTGFLMSKYSQGANFEREVMKLFKENGYQVVRMAGSKGSVVTGPLKKFDCDVIATKETHSNKYQVGCVLMQMKRTKK